MTGFAFDTAGIGFDNSLFGFDGVTMAGHNDGAWLNTGGALNTADHALNVRFNSGQTVSPIAAALVETGAAPTIIIASNTGTSGGTAAAAWNLPTGFGNRKRLILSSNIAHFNSAPAFTKKIDLGSFTNGQSITNTAGFDGFGLHPIAATDNHRDGVSMKMWLDAGGNVGQGIINLPGVTQIMATWSIKNMPGNYWPGATSLNNFGTASAFKMLWLFLQNNTSMGGGNGPIANGGNGTGFEGGSPVGQGNDNDLILLNWAGSPGFKIDGNNLSDRLYFGDYSDIDPKTRFDWNGRNTYTVWMYVDPANPTTGNTKVFVQWSNSFGVVERYFDLLPQHVYTPTTNRPLFEGGAGTIHRWDYLNIPGYIGNVTQTTATDVRFQDIQVNAGSNALAMVQLHNASTIGASTCIVQCPIFTWADQVAEVETRLGDINEANPVYCTLTASAPVTSPTPGLNRIAFGRIN